MMARLAPIWEAIKGYADAAGRALGLGITWLAARPAARAALTTLALIALALAALHPLSFGTLPETPDGLLHLYRLVGLDHAGRGGGGLWPRYAPGLAFGYGLPIFNYYAPLYLYPFWLLRVIGFSFVDAFLLGLGLLSLLGLVGAFQLGRLYGGPVGGLMAAAAYAYAPYTLYNVPRRAAVAEFFALALLPWALYAFARLAERPTRFNFGAAVMAFALLIPLHNISTVAAALCLAALSLFLAALSPPGARLITAGRLALAGLVAISLTAFYWLPALAETRYVKINAVTDNVADIQPQNNFQSLEQTLRPPRTADLMELHPPVPRVLGWPQIALSLAAAGLGAYHLLSLPIARLPAPHLIRRDLAWPLLLIGLALGFLLLTLPVSGAAYRYLPLLGYFQFPWRMLGPASLFLAVGAGIGAAWLYDLIRPAWGQAAWLAGTLIACLLYGLTWLYGAYIPRPPAEDITDAQAFERATGWIGTSSFGEYVPRWAQQLPPLDQLTGLYAQGEAVPRLQPVPGVALIEAEWGTLSADLLIEAEQPTELVFNWFYFPGFQAYLDSQPAEIVITQPEGLLRVDVPAGESALSIRFGPTRLRLIAMIVSGVVGLGLPLLILLPKGLWLHPAEAPAADPPDPYLGVRAALAALVAGLLVFTLKVTWIDNTDNLFKRQRTAEETQAALSLPSGASFRDQVRLLGADLPRGADVQAGGALPLRLYWSLAGGQITQSYASTLYLRDQNGSIITTDGHQHVGEWPVWAWIPGFYVEERFEVQVPPGTPPGTYSLDAALYCAEEQLSLEARDPAGNPLGITAQVAQIEVRRPWWPASPRRITLSSPIDERLGGGLVLLQAAGFEPGGTYQAGDQLGVAWLLRAQRRPAADYAAHLLWLAADGEIAGETPALAPAVGYPTDQWRRGDVWRGTHLIYVPGRLESGTYDVAMQLRDAQGAALGAPVTLGQMRVQAPERSFSPPAAPDVPLEVAWANGITLLGYDLPARRAARGDGLRLTLYWQAGEDIPASLTTFIHLVDAETGAIAAQQDRIPLGGARPTSSWAPGEVLADDIVLFVGQDVPPGAYLLRLGWYNALTGARITAGEADFWTLDPVISVE